MRTAWCLALVIVLPGCMTTTPPTDDPTEVPDLRPALQPITMLVPTLLGRMAGGAEPNIAVDAEDRIYVTTPLALWRSTDGAKTFQALGEAQCGIGQFGVEAPAAACPEGYTHSNPGLVGGGDGDIAIDTDGTIHWAGLSTTGDGVPYQKSSNHGEKWSNPKNIADGGNNMDREWIDARNLTVFANWRDTNSGKGVAFRMWDPETRKWQDEVVVSEDALAGPVVHDTSSDMLYIPMVPFGANEVQVARSEDNGTEWDIETAAANIPDHTAGEGAFVFKTTIFPVAAVDAAGTVYLVWSTSEPAAAKAAGTPGVFLSVSHDEGRSWSDPLRVSPEGRVAVFPWIAAGKAGRVAIVWYENRNGLPNDGAPDLWDVKLIESTDADAKSPTFEAGTLNQEPIHIGYICTDGLFCTLTGRDRSLLDFFEVAIRPNGQPIVTWSADDTVRQGAVRVYVGGVAEGAPLL